MNPSLYNKSIVGRITNHKQREEKHWISMFSNVINPTFNFGLYMVLKFFGAHKKY